MIVYPNPMAAAAVEADRSYPKRELRRAILTMQAYAMMGWDGEEVHVTYDDQPEDDTAWTEVVDEESTMFWHNGELKGRMTLHARGESFRAMLTVLCGAWFGTYSATEDSVKWEQ